MICNERRSPRIGGPHLSELPEELLGLVYGALDSSHDRQAFRSSAAFLRRAGPIADQVQRLTVDLRRLAEDAPTTKTATPLTLRAALELTRLEIHVGASLPPSAVAKGLRTLFFCGPCLPRLRCVSILAFDENRATEQQQQQQQQRRDMRTCPGELRAVGDLLRRVAPSLTDLCVDTRLNLTHHFYDGLLLHLHDDEMNERQRHARPSPSLETLCIPAGDSFPLAAVRPAPPSSRSASWPWPALRVLDLRHGLRNGHGDGLSIVLRACPNLSRLYLNTLVPGIDWTRSASLISVSIDRLYSPDPQSVRDLRTCVHFNPRLDEIFIDDFFVNDLRVLEAMHLVAATIRERGAAAAAMTGTAAVATTGAQQQQQQQPPPRLSVATVLCDGAFVPDTTFYTGVGEVTDEDVNAAAANAALSASQDMSCINADLVARLDMFDEFVAPVVDLGLHYMCITASGVRLLRTGLGLSRTRHTTATGRNDDPASLLPLQCVSMLKCEVGLSAVDEMLRRQAGGRGQSTTVKAGPRTLVLGFNSFFAEERQEQEDGEDADVAGARQRGTAHAADAASTAGAADHDCDVHVICCCCPSHRCCPHHPESVGAATGARAARIVRLAEPPVDEPPRADACFVAYAADRDHMSSAIE